jgi:hypothetical protein
MDESWCTEKEPRLSSRPPSIARHTGCSAATAAVSTSTSCLSAVPSRLFSRHPPPATSRALPSRTCSIAPRRTLPRSPMHTTWSPLPPRPRLNSQSPMPDLSISLPRTRVCKMRRERLPLVRPLALRTDPPPPGKCFSLLATETRACRIDTARDPAIANALHPPCPLSRFLRQKGGAQRVHRLTRHHALHCFRLLNSISILRGATRRSTVESKNHG